MTSILLSTSCGRVNERAVASVEWRNPGTLPARNGLAIHPGLAGPVAGIHNDVLIVGGGANFPDSMPWLGGKKRYYDEIYLFRRENENYFIPDEKRFTMPYPSAYGASSSTVKGVVYAGGENEQGLMSKVLLFRFESVQKELAVDTLPDLPFPLTNAAATTDGAVVYLAGGETSAGVSDKLLYLDLNAADLTWKILSALPQPVSHSVLTFRSDGSHRSLHLIGGRRKNKDGPSDFFSHHYRFDLDENGWQQMASLPYALSAGTGWSNGEDILLFGGDQGMIFKKTEQLIIAILQENDPSKREILNEQKATLQAGHPGFGREILHYNARRDAWRVIGVMPFEAPVTTTAVVAGRNEVIIPSGEIKAGVRSPLIRHGKSSFEAHH